MELKRIGVLSLGKIAGLFGVTYGLLIGILFSVIYARVGDIPGIAEQLSILNQLGYSSIIILPLIYGLTYFIAGVVTAFIYNIFAKWVGGIELELKKETRKK